jgi:hypothetical protein
MAGDVGGITPDAHGPLAALVGFAGATLGAFGLWLANRMLGKAAFQTAINSGFKELTDQLQEERKAYRDQLDAERLAWAGERAQLRGEIINLTQAIESLKSLLRRNGIAVPDMHTPAPDFVVLEEKPD